MVFSSLFFLFTFLSLCLLTYILCPSIKIKNICLLVFSLIFYSFAGPKYLPLLAGMTLISYLSALFLDRYEPGTMPRRCILIADVVLMLGALAYFKYTGLLAGSIFTLFGKETPSFLSGIVLPIGISFYTFQLLSYTIDVYREDVEVQTNYFKLLLYAALFHQCIAGPIVRYSTVAHDIDHRKVNVNEVSEGILRFSIGLAKKAVLANGCASMLNELIPENFEAMKNTPVLSMWLGMFCYMLQIYLDFSAYSDMAIGMGKMVGFHYDENFNYPYVASSVQDFWRRWHISLSSFFRDYVYIPLGGNRVSKPRFIFNMFVVWGLTGLWHGGSWNFLFWGLYYFIFLILERFFLKKYMDKAPVWAKPLCHIYTLLVVFFGWVIFYFDSLPKLGEALKTLFLLGGKTHAFYGEQTGLVLSNNLFFLIIAILCSLPIYSRLHKTLTEWSKESTGLFHVLSVFDIVTMVVCLILATLALVGNSYNPFLYFRF